MTGTAGTGRRAMWMACLCGALLLLGAPLAGAAALLADDLRQARERLLETGDAEPLTVIVESSLPAAAADALRRNGFVPRHQLGGRFELKLPAARLLALADALPPGSLLRNPFPLEPHVVSQGVVLTGAGDMHALEVAGAGVRIGVIDLGFSGLAAAQAAGELPANLSIVDYTGSGTGGINHGTNVAQIVHDMAPQAVLYLAKVETEVQLQQAVNDMAAAGVEIINHSAGWYGAAFYDGSGPICATVNGAAAGGIQWVNSAGNDRLRHYLGIFADTDGNLRHEFVPGQDYNTVTLAANANVRLVLNWDAYPSTSVDYDLFLYDGDPGAGGSIVARSENRQGAFFPYPYEFINFTAPAAGTFYVVVTKRRSNTAHLRLSLFSLGADLAHPTTTSSLAQPADCAGSLTVGATSLSDVPEGFSAEGPTTDGRAKPELAAPNRVATSISSSFIGTSAAAPHVAGALGLLVAQQGLSPQQAAQVMLASLHDVHVPGFDYRTGGGRLSLDADRDGLNRDQELFYGTDPLKDDSDGDGLSDYDEIFVYGADPLNPDTDGDGLSDYEEILVYGSDPLVSDKGDIGPAGAPDGVVNVADLQRLMRFVSGLQQPDSRERVLADMNDDGVLDVLDVQEMVRILGY